MIAAACNDSCIAVNFEIEAHFFKEAPYVSAVMLSDIFNKIPYLLFGKSVGDTAVAALLDLLSFLCDRRHRVKTYKAPLFGPPDSGFFIGSFAFVRYNVVE